MYMSCPTVCMCLRHMPGFPHCSEKDIGSPEIGVREVVNHHGGAGNHIHLVFKRSKWSHLYRP